MAPIKNQHVNVHVFKCSPRSCCSSVHPSNRHSVDNALVCADIFCQTLDMA